MTKAPYRIGITEAKQATLWHDQESYDQAEYTWRMLHLYGRTGIRITVQQREQGGSWRTINPADVF